MSKAFLFVCPVFRQISSCFSTRSSAKFRWQCLHATRSSRGFGANTERRVAAGVFLLAAGEGGTGFFFGPPPEPPLISMLTELFGFTVMVLAEFEFEFVDGLMVIVLLRARRDSGTSRASSL